MKGLLEEKALFHQGPIGNDVTRDNNKGPIRCVDSDAQDAASSQRSNFEQVLQSNHSL